MLCDRRFSANPVVVIWKRSSGACYSAFSIGQRLQVADNETFFGPALWMGNRTLIVMASVLCGFMSMGKRLLSLATQLA